VKSSHGCWRRGHYRVVVHLPPHRRPASAPGGSICPVCWCKNCTWLPRAIHVTPWSVRGVLANLTCWLTIEKNS
jgi:hypothetical protein